MLDHSISEKQQFKFSLIKPSLFDWFNWRNFTKLVHRLNSNGMSDLCAGETFPVTPSPHQYTRGYTKSEISVFNHPSGAYRVWFQSPPLWWLTGLHLWQPLPTVNFDKTYSRPCHFYSWWCNFYSQLQNDRHCPVCTYVSFVTNCKKFCHQL